MPHLMCMYACMHVCICMYTHRAPSCATPDVYMYVYVCTPIGLLHVPHLMYMYVCMYVCICMYTHRAPSCATPDVYVCMYACMCVCIYMCVCVCICMYACVCIHTPMYMNIWVSVNI